MFKHLIWKTGIHSWLVAFRWRTGEKQEWIHSNRTEKSMFPLWPSSRREEVCKAYGTPGFSLFICNTMWSSIHKESKVMKNPTLACCYNRIARAKSKQSLGISKKTMTPVTSAPEVEIMRWQRNSCYSWEFIFPFKATKPGSMIAFPPLWDHVHHLFFPPTFSQPRSHLVTTFMQKRLKTCDSISEVLVVGFPQQPH